MALKQDGRLCTLTTPLGADVLVPRRVKGWEAVSELFRFDLELLSENHSIGLESMIGQNVTLSLDLAGGGKRHVNAVVSRFSYVGSERHCALYRAELVPWLWLLTQRTDCRIFQHQSVPDIVRQVFTRLKFSDFEFRLNGKYQPLVNCVQYRESDYSFIARLLEEEGVHYYFEHDEKCHKLILVDRPSQNAPCPDQSACKYDANAGGNRPEDRIEVWRVEQELRPGKYTLTDFNFMSPGTSLLVDAASAVAAGPTANLDIYDFPGAYVRLGAEDDGKLDHGEGRVRVRAQEGDAKAIVASGSGCCRAFRAGYRTDLEGHPRSDWNQSWLLLSVEHELTQAGGWGSGDPEVSHYENRFTCMPHRVPFRPLRKTQKPRVFGPQTAIVTGPEGEEIHVDRFGRIKVQFPWDREGKRNENSSCWIRVAQSLAGKQWGAQFNPRIGQEVIVEFLEGDPDQPIVTGRVYNGEQPIPYGVATQSGLKTRSSKQGSSSSYNEIMFEDKKGAERLHIQAERDMSVIVKNDRKASIGANDSLSAAGNRSKTVGGSESVSIAQDRNTQIGGSELLAVAASSVESVGATKSVGTGANFGVQAGANIGLIAAGAVQIQAGVAVSITCGASSITMTQAGLINIAGTVIMINGAVAAEMSAPIATVAGLAVMQMGALTVSSGDHAAIIGDTVAVQGSSKVRINC